MQLQYQFCVTKYSNKKYKFFLSLNKTMRQIKVFNTFIASHYRWILVFMYESPTKAGSVTCFQGEVLIIIKIIVQ